MQNILSQLINAALLFVLLLVLSVKAAPVVGDVMMLQDENSRQVMVTYNLSASAIVTLAIETNGVNIGDNFVTTISGDVNRVVEDSGSKSIVWSAGVDWPEHLVEDARARVTAWSLDTPPQYCAVDLAAGSETESFNVYYYPSEAGVPGGVSNNTYKTSMILLRQVEATPGTGFLMGSPTSDPNRDASRESEARTWVSKPYYIGVYQITQRQWRRIMDTNPSYFDNPDHWEMRPVEFVNYNLIRGSSDGAGWPGSSAVDSDSFLGILRAKTDIETFDLPTEAQWEWACRAGTTGALNNGKEILDNRNTDSDLALLGRYKHNGGLVESETGSFSSAPKNCTPENGTAIVGSYLPNAWGLYDMHGNVFEFCIDQFQNTLLGGSDPKGPDVSARTFSCRGGSSVDDAYRHRSPYRSHLARDHVGRRDFGFRVVRNLP